MSNREGRREAQARAERERGSAKPHGRVKLSENEFSLYVTSAYILARESPLLVIMSKTQRCSDMRLQYESQPPNALCSGC